MPFLHPQHRNIGRGPHRQVAKLLVPDLARGRPRGSQNHLVQRHAHIQELRHHVQHVLHARIHAADVQVGGDGIRPEPLAHRRHRLPEQKAAAAMPHVEDHAPTTSFEKIREKAPLVVEHRNPAEICVRVDVPGAQFLEYEFLKRAFRPERSEVDHHRDVGQRPRRDSVFHRGPLRTRVVRRFDAHDGVLVARGHFGRGFGVHFREILLRRARHALSHDVQECQYAGLGAIYHAVFEIRKIAPAGTARVGHRGHARAEGEAIRIDAVVAAVRAALSGASVNVNVHVDEARNDIQARDIHYLGGFGGRNIRGDGRDLAARNSHVEERAGLAFAVDDVASLEQ